MRRKQPVLVELGHKIRALRIKRGLSQEAFADLVDLDRSYMGRIERGENNTTVLNIYRIARALHIAPAKLFPNRLPPI